MSLSFPLPWFQACSGQCGGLVSRLHLMFLYLQWEKSNAPPHPPPGQRAARFGDTSHGCSGLTLTGGAAGDGGSPLGPLDGVWGTRVSPALVPVLSHSGSWCPRAHRELVLPGGERGQGTGRLQSGRGA